MQGSASWPASLLVMAVLALAAAGVACGPSEHVPVWETRVVSAEDGGITVHAVNVEAVYGGSAAVFWAIEAPPGLGPLSLQRVSIADNDGHEYNSRAVHSFGRAAGLSLGLAVFDGPTFDADTIRLEATELRGETGTVTGKWAFDPFLENVQRGTAWRRLRRHAFVGLLPRRTVGDVTILLESAFFRDLRGVRWQYFWRVVEDATVTRTDVIYAVLEDGRVMPVTKEEFVRLRPQRPGGGP